MKATEKAIEEARAHVAEAKKWGYSPDPWAEAIIDLAAAEELLSELREYGGT